MNFLEKKREVLSNLVRKGTEDTGEVMVSPTWVPPKLGKFLPLLPGWTVILCSVQTSARAGGCRRPFSVNRGAF